MNSELPRFMTIRQVARLGILSEHRLRVMDRQGMLPCIHAGNKCLINIDRLIDQLNALGPKGGATE